MSIDNALVAQKNTVFEEIQKLRDAKEAFDASPSKVLNMAITKQHELLLTLFRVLEPVWSASSYSYKLDEIREIVRRIVNE